MDFDGCVSACGMQSRPGAGGSTGLEPPRRSAGGWWNCAGLGIWTPCSKPPPERCNGPPGAGGGDGAGPDCQRGLTVSQDVENMELIKLVAYDPAGTKTAGFCQGVGADFTVINRGPGDAGAGAGGQQQVHRHRHGAGALRPGPAGRIRLRDSTNDLPMFRSVGTAVAMGGSPAALCQAADYVTARCWRGALPRALAGAA